MDFVRFPVSLTTIFPVANAKNGSQLLTERNLLTRESVANHSIIPYVCGPSYTHSQDDFLINATIGQHVLYISGGMAIVHGHFVHLNSASNHAIAVDISEANRQAGSGTKLSGRLFVGLRAMYSNPTTMAASLLSDVEDNLYTGIQVVILPPNKFYLPEGNPDEEEMSATPEDQVTAHLFLGEILYSESEGIRVVTPNAHRQECLDGDRISNLRNILDKTYVTNDGLDPYKLYTMAGKASSEDAEEDWRSYWTDSTDSLIIWDANPRIQSSKDTIEDIWRRNDSVSAGDNNPFVTESTFRYDTTDNKLKLVMPHKQVDGMTDGNGNARFYVPNVIEVPTANRANGTGGVLDNRWINFLNGLDDKIATMYRMPGGKMRQFIDVLTTRDDLPSPPIAYYDEKNRDAAYYDNRLQYSFNLLQTQVAQLNDRFLEFQSKLEADWKEAVTADVSAELTDKYNLTQSGLETLRSDVGGLQGDLASFQGDVANIASTIQESGASLQAHLEAYQALADRVTTLESKWTSVTPADEASQTQQNTNDISSIETQIQELKNSITTIQTEVNNKISAISGSVETVSSSINTIYSKLYARDGGDTGDIKDASAAIEQLRSQYDYLYDAIHDLYDGINSEVQKATASLYSQLKNSMRREIEAQVAALADKYNVSAEWMPGDYVLVAQDQTVVSENEDGTSFPSTMYVVVPGMTPLDSKYVASYYDVYFTDLSTPVNRVFSTNVTSASVYNEAVDTYNQAVATVKRQVPARFVYGYELGGNDVAELGSVDELPDVYNSTVMLDELYASTAMIEGVRGVPGKDYFVLRYKYPLTDSVSDGNNYTDEVSGQTYTDIQYKTFRWVSVFFTLNLVSDKVELDKDSPIMLSGGVPYAQEERVGGFLNVGSDVMGGGYVSRDDEGHLRLNDFELLAAGLSAYQLGEDRTEGAGLDISDLQEVFDQYVNERIAFPNETQIYRITEKGLRPDEITVDINIGSTSEGTLNIHDVDSRFNTAFHLNITGAATENVVLNITNCQRLRITMDQTSNPTILLKNVCLFYDADIMDRVADIQGLTLWYTQLDETQPKLEVDGMTVIYQGNLEPKGTYKFWTYTAGNDYSYAYALRQLTFASDGSIIGAGVAVTDNATINIQNEPTIFAASFTLPQSIGLAYPATRLTKQIKITGTFATAYQTTDDGGGFIVKNTTFTMLSQKYLRYTGVKEWINGTISFFTQVTRVKGADGVDPNSLTQLGDEYAIDGWESGSYHIFYGGAVN